MAIQSMVLDPNAVAYTNDEIIGKINAATDNITRASSVDAAARPIAALEVTNAELALSAAKDNLDALADTARGYIKTSPTTGEFPVISIQRGTVATGGKLDTDYDDVPIE